MSSTQSISSNKSADKTAANHSTPNKKSNQPSKELLAKLKGHVKPNAFTPTRTKLMQEGAVAQGTKRWNNIVEKQNDDEGGADVEGDSGKGKDKATE